MTSASRFLGVLLSVFRSFDRRTLAARALAILGLALSVPARSVQAAPADPASADLASISRRDHVLHDELEGGELWSKGATYKAGFGRDGARFVPFLGANAPRNYPVHFVIASVTLGGVPIALDDAALPIRDGDVVRYERGGLVEIYELSLRSVEQKFAFSSLPEGKSGDLVVRLSTESELTRREAADAFEFTNELGGVRYGLATALDASGASVAAPTTSTEQGIEIRVPAEFVARAQLPLVIDPIVSTFTFTVDDNEALHPDVAYDTSTDRWLIVWVEVFSATDHDVVWHLTNPVSPIGSTGAVDATTSHWTDPVCANNNGSNQFLVAVETGATQPTAIRGRTITIGTPTVTVGPSFLISPANTLSHRNPDVGGNWSTSASANYAVVYETASPVVNDIYARLVTPAGTLVGAAPIAIDASAGTVDSFPSISKTNGGNAWNIVWQREASSTHSGFAARLAPQGVLTTNPVQFASHVTRPTASSYLTGTFKWLACTADGLFALFDGGSVVAYSSFDSAFNFDPPTNSFPVRVDVDTDGTAFAIAFVYDNIGFSSTANGMATIGLAGSELRASQEDFEACAAGPEYSTGPVHASIASQYGAGGTLRRHLAVFRGFNDGYIEGAYYDVDPFISFCRPGHDVGACPCSNQPVELGRGCHNSFGTGARLIGSGTTSLANDTVQLSSDGLLPNGLLIFNQGTAVVAPVQFGQGLRCVGGTTKRLYTSSSQSGAAVAPPLPSDPSLHERSAALGDTIAPGTSRYYYVYYRDPSVLGGCASSLTYNTSTSLQVIWTP